MICRLFAVNSTTSPEDRQPLPLKVAEFSGASRVAVEAPSDIVDYLDLRLNFKPNQHTGLLFYWHDMGRYLAVFLERGFVNVQVTMGADTAILRRVTTICDFTPAPSVANSISNIVKHKRETPEQYFRSRFCESLAF